MQNKVKLLGKGENLKVGYVGHLYSGKGMEIINSIANKFGDDVDFHIIGGTERDINFWKDKILNKNVYFYGHISHKNVINFINSLDLCLLPNQKIVRPHGGKDNKIIFQDTPHHLNSLVYVTQETHNRI